MSTMPKGDETPRIVLLTKQEGHKVVVARLRRLLSVMHLDSMLNIAPAVLVLLTTAGNCILRLNQYLLYPYAVCLMCRKWFPDSFLLAIQAFLAAKDDDLDIGFGLPLQQLALERGLHEAYIFFVG